MVNEWKENVRDKTVNLLLRWIEHRLGKMFKGANLPREGRRYVYYPKTNSFGKAIYTVEIWEGLELAAPSTAPKEFNELDEFTYAFRDLPMLEQTIILSYVDPFDELEGKEQWREFMKSMGVRKNCESVLAEAMSQLQKCVERRGLVKVMDEDGLWGWSSIAGFLQCSVPTAMKRARRMRMPISMIGGEVYTTKARLQAFLENSIEQRPYWKTKEEQ